VVEKERLEAVEKTLRRTQRTLALVSVVSVVSVAMSCWMLFSTPKSMVLEHGSRTATLSPDGLVFRFQGEQRALLDVHSGLIVHDGDGYRTHIDARRGAITVPPKP